MINDFLNKLKSYFEISNFERRGVYSLLFILALFALYGWVKSNYTFSEASVDVAARNAFANQVRQSFTEKTSRNQSYDLDIDKREKLPLKSFNPNGDSYDMLVLKGVEPKVARTIVNYRNKGGKFTSKESLRKIYSISDEYYQELSPYIMIVNTATFENNTEEFAKVDVGRTPEKQVIIELNSTTVEELMLLKGIGKYYAGKIARDVEWKGGYYTVDQLYYIQDIPKETVDEIKPYVWVDQKKIIKIHLNTADFAQLRKHPFLSYKETQAILNYRDQHGPFKDLEELKKLHLLRDKDFSQLLPYLDLN